MPLRSGKEFKIYMATDTDLNVNKKYQLPINENKTVNKEIEILKDNSEVQINFGNMSLTEELTNSKLVNKPEILLFEPELGINFTAWLSHFPKFTKSCLGKMILY